MAYVFSNASFMSYKQKCCGNTHSSRTNSMAFFFLSIPARVLYLLKKKNAEEKRTQNMKNYFYVTCGGGKSGAVRWIRFVSLILKRAHPRAHATYSLTYCNFSSLVSLFFFFFVFFIVFIVTYFALVPHRSRTCIPPNKKKKTHTQRRIKTKRVAEWW